MSRMDPLDFDCILLEGMRFFGHVGVLESEKRQGQDFQVDLFLEFLRIPACETDKLEDTVDYGHVFDTVRHVVEPARFDLIERLAGEIATRVLADHGSVLAVTVTVRKPHAPIEGRFDAMGVRIRRERGAV
jgi:7,8-dihydroneopterin aldolase/epimerase/oxygenase